jgi:hypothetical protein
MEITREETMKNVERMLCSSKKENLLQDLLRHIRYDLEIRAMCNRFISDYEVYGSLDHCPEITDVVKSTIEKLGQKNENRD